MAEAGRSIWTDQSGDGDRGQGQIGATRTYQPVRKYIDALMHCLHDLRVNIFFSPTLSIRVSSFLLRLQIQT